MTSPPDQRVTEILRQVADGKRRPDDLVAVLYDDLRRIAERLMARERPGHTLQATAVVHEAYLKLIDQRWTRWQDRAHFLAVAARLIRRILVDHARGRAAVKRGGDRERVAGEEIAALAETPDVDLVSLDDALNTLAEIDERQAVIVELRFFGGLSIPEIAEVQGIPKRSIDRHWSCAKAWLYRELSGD